MAKKQVAETVSLSRKGYNFILDQILNGILKPGDEINRRRIAEELNISLAPINEAVAQLEAENLLEIVPRRGTRVRVIRKDDIKGHFILRVAIECQAARLYCGHLIRENHQKLLEMAKAIDLPELERRDRAMREVEFHSALIGLTKNQFLIKEFQKVMLLDLFFELDHIVPSYQPQPVDHHEKLIKLLEVDDPDKAENAIRKHIERGRVSLLELE